MTKVEFKFELDEKSQRFPAWKEKSQLYVLIEEKNFILYA